MQLQLQMSAKQQPSMTEQQLLIAQVLHVL